MESNTSAHLDKHSKPARSLAQTLVWTSIFSLIAYFIGLGGYILLGVFISGSIALLFGLGSGEEANIAASGTDTVVSSITNNVELIVGGLFAVVGFCLLSIIIARTVSANIAHMPPVVQGLLPIASLYVAGFVGLTAIY